MRLHSSLHNQFMLLVVALLAMSVSTTYASDYRHGAPTEVRDFNMTTQGPPWPPSTVVDKDGNFVVVGTVLTRDNSGTVVSVPGKAALVSKNTVPPLDSNGVEDFSNPLAAPYKVIRYLDLRHGSRDRKIVLYSPSFGPSKGDFGGGPRIPMEGKSRYNLNMIPSPCPEVFPATSQLHSFTRKSFPLHKYPVLGLQGDQVAYDVDTGEPYDPMTRSGTGCENGCSGESMVDFYDQAPVTLGKWIQARGNFRIALTRYSRSAGGYTAARIDLKLRNLLPHSVYTAWGVKQRVFSQGRFPGPLGVPSVFVSDKNGRAEASFEIPHPFPARELDDEGLRLIGIEISYHPDAQNWGACGERFGVGYRVFNWFDIMANGERDLDNLITVPAHHHHH